MCFYMGMVNKQMGWRSKPSRFSSLYDSLSSCPEIWEGAETDGMDSAEKLLHHPSAARSIRVRRARARLARSAGKEELAPGANARMA